MVLTTTTEKGSDPAPPAPPVTLGPPVDYVRWRCPKCDTVRRFESRPNEGDAGRWLVCRCGAVLGQIVEQRNNYTALRLAGV